MAQRESKLSRKIIAEINKQGGFAFKVHGGPYMMSGLPDIIACVRGRFYGLETKMPDGGHASPTQQLVHNMIKDADGTACVVRSVQEALIVTGLHHTGANRP